MADRPSTSAMKELDPLIGTTVSGRYRVHTLIGQGGMGKVFQAQQIPLNRAVALKVLEANRVDAGFHRRFFQEAAILAKLRSRHTVTIYDYGRDGDLYFIAMELATGGTLGQLMAKEGPFEVQRALQIGQQICRSLREAHGQGVIHRDLKPGNVVITQSEDGEEIVKVLDFGLAKRLDRKSLERLSMEEAREEDTENDTVPGSPKYMAPEVIRQQPIDGRCDIYGLGIMLYQMLTGVVPFDRDNPMDILVAHLHEAPKPLREVKPELKLPEAVEKLVMRCIEKSPDARFPDVQQLLDALRTVNTELRPSFRPPPSDPAPSGVRKSGVPSLRLKAEDTLPPKPLQRIGLSPAMIIAIAAAVAALIALAAALGTRGAAHAPAAVSPTQAPAPTPAPAPTQAPQQAVAQQAEGPPDMVFSPEAVAAADAVPTLKLRVTSEPPGANIFLRTQHMGTTPTTIDWRSPHAQRGKDIIMVLRLDGYAPYTVRRSIEGNELDVHALLEPRAAAPAPAAPAEIEEEEESSEAPVELEAPPEPPVMDVRPAVPQADVIELPEDQLGRP